MGEVITAKDKEYEAEVGRIQGVHEVRLGRR